MGLEPNALARVGTEADSLPALKHIVSQYGNEPQTVAAAIAAASKLSNSDDPSRLLGKVDQDPALITLASLQHRAAQSVSLRGLPLDVESANSDLLKLALIVVGLERSPGNLLNPRHTDSEMVRVLGGHHDPIVSQYSVWAVSESGSLSIGDLGIDLRDIERFPDNVRGWLLRLIASDASAAAANWEILRAGTSDASPEARLGLARGLQENHLDIFEPWSLDWVTREVDFEVRLALLAYLARNSDNVPSYQDYVAEIYEAEPPGSQIRQALETASQRTKLGVRLRQIAVTFENDLFAMGGVTVVKNQINIQNVQAGAVRLQTH